MRVCVAAVLIVLAGAAPFTLAGGSQAVPPRPDAPFTSRPLDPLVESVSPDGKFVTYHKGEAKGRIYLRSEASGTERLLIDAPGEAANVVWALDNQRLAYRFTASAQPARAEIRVVSVVTGETGEPSETGTPLGWTTAGALLFNRPSGLNGISGPGAYLRPPGADEARLIFPSTWTGSTGRVGAVTPDGGTVIVSEYGRLRAADVATGRARTVTAFEGLENGSTLSPDGRLLAYLGCRSDADCGLFVAPLDRLPVREPVRVMAMESAPDVVSMWWTTSGGLALQDATYRGTHVFKIPVNAATGRAAGSLTRLTRGGLTHRNPAPSPDSRSIAFNLNGPGGGIRLMDASGGGARPVGRTDGTMSAWISAEEVLLTSVTSGPPNLTFALEALDVRSGARRSLGPDLPNYRAFNGRRGEILYYTGPAFSPGSVLKARSMVAGTERTVATVDVPGPLTVSPDGRHIAYTRLIGRGANASGEMLLMTIDGVPERRLLTTTGGTATPASWSPDGRFLLYFDVDDTPLVMNVEMGESWKLLEADDKRDWSDDDAFWSPDGSYIVLAGTETRRERLSIAIQGVTYEAVAKLMKDSERSRGSMRGDDARNPLDKRRRRTRRGEAPRANSASEPTRASARE